MKHSPEFRKALGKAIRVLTREVRDSCIIYIEYKTYCNACSKYVSELTLQPRRFIGMPGCVRLIPIPQCSRS